MYRVAIFIDGGYLDKVLQNELHCSKLDYVALTKAIAYRIHSETDIFRCYYYHCPAYQSNPPTPDESRRLSQQQAFFAALNRLPRFTLRMGRLARRGPDQKGRYSYEQKMVDVCLSIDLVHLSSKGQITHAAIVAGDSDFVPAIEMAKNEGVSLWLFHGIRAHNSLLDAADERILMTSSFVAGLLRRE